MQHKTLTHYTITSELSIGTKNLIYRGHRNKDQVPVIVKVPKAEYPSLREIAKLKHEYEIMQGLTLNHVVQPLGLEKYNHGLALILEDFGGQSLYDVIAQQGPLSVEVFLSIAIAITNSLSEIHQHRIIHKDIKPSNIIVNLATQDLKITDFGISSLLSSENQGISTPNALEGTLAYLSPEQTGRMNRLIDYRTDFYSLGITFYELLTGELPFDSLDPIELIHAHLAKEPPNPTTLNPQIPPVISNIILKLLAKNAEDRYQTAIALKQDLLKCSQQWQERQQIEDFAIAQNNISDQFQIPQKLYGREAEVKTLLQAFEIASFGHTELMLVSGYSGIGKSSLVHEIHKPIVKRKGFFISGKFDQFKRNIPYASLIEAFQELVQQLLTETEDKIEQWKQKLLKALGQNGAVIIDVIPEVELIIGPQPPVPHLGPTESQNRFNLVFQKFIAVFTQAEHPLVIFLDDLQWADSPSLKFLNLLVTNPESRYLLIIGAYRDNEVSPSHPLMLTLHAIEESEVIVKTIEVKPLDLDTTNKLISDTLYRPTEDTLELAQLCHNKTGGNPFFLTQLLKSLYSEELFYFDYINGQWNWDVAAIRQCDITENVVDLMINKLRKLPATTQESLKLASCIGNRFSLHILATVSEQSLPEVANSLWDALQEGFIIPSSDTYRIPLLWQKIEEVDKISVDYRFLHDRVQQAAYTLIPESEKAITHLKMGRLLLKQVTNLEEDEKLFDIVNHLNAGSALIEEDKEKHHLASLNLVAGQKAKDSTAYEPALKYFSSGLVYLGDNAWQMDYDLAFNLYQERSECEYLCGNFETAENLFDLIITQAKTSLEKAQVQIVRLALYDNTGKFVENIRLASQTLEVFGLNIPTGGDDIPPAFEAELTVYRENLAKHKIPELALIPDNTNPEIEICMNVLMNMTGPAYFTNQDLLALITLKMVNLSIEYGNSEASAHGYAFWGIVAGSRLLEYENGYEFGQLALKMNEKFHTANLTCKVFNLVAGLISHWRSPMKNNLPILRQGYQDGVNTGDVYTSYISYHVILQRILMGHDFNSILDESDKFLDFLRQSKNHVFVGVQQTYQQVIRNLQDLTREQASLSDENFDEMACVQMWMDNQFLPGVAMYNIFKMQLLYLYGSYSEALVFAKASCNTVVFVSGIPNQVEHNFYYSLTLAQLYPTASPSDQQQYFAQLDENQKMLKIWADNCPENFGHKYLLVEAEKARIQGKIQQALNLYEEAISSAQVNDFIQSEALANELAARFWIQQGNQKFAKLYMTEAYYGYTRWQATRKVQQLDQNYRHLINKVATAPLYKKTRTTSSSSSTEMDTGSSLDFATIMKASQALAGEILLERLLTKLMEILLENTGATVGYLLLNKSPETAISHLEDFLIEASVSVTHKKVAVLQSLAIGNKLPKSIINYVLRTNQNLVLEDANQEHKYSGDPYFQLFPPKSILCTPLLNQGKLTGIIYLENNLTASAFTYDRIGVVQLLSGQAAISIDNARLYKNLETKVTQRTQELQKALEELQASQQQLIQSEKMAALGQLVAGVAHEINTPLGAILSSSENTSKALTETLAELPKIPEKLNTEQQKCFFDLLEASLESSTAISSRDKRQHKRNVIRELEALNILNNRRIADSLTDMGIYKNVGEFLSILQSPDVDWLLKIAYNIARLQGNNRNIITAVNRASKVVFALKNYARYDHLGDPQRVNIIESIETVLELYHNQLKHGVEVHRDFAAIPDIPCFPDELIQVWTNLIHNGIQAMKNQGDLRIRVLTIEDEVLVQIEDSGQGIPVEIQDRIFEPFFTTKPAGEGSGLGLDIVKKIIEKHRGTLSFTSQPGKTVFTVALPMV
ncbi:trifunctional serine/threonine-protein kinase/ATP-binding protein/sensor histidine kinase [Spirulina subsalsa]|uniref:trifunctional serine/threonine-protein kinase/ATP-binding protein/sensor histidine kinase n=1 Tax=Spirulina subsalsa TaxID=54311 RepID=UPI00030961E7|nr:ATP-binding sensor histidine kinase [Spirulina subsalsa]